MVVTAVTSSSLSFPASAVTGVPTISTTIVISSLVLLVGMLVGVGGCLGSWDSWWGHARSGLPLREFSTQGAYLLAEMLGFLMGSIDVILECLIVAVVGTMNVSEAGLNAVDTIIIFDGFSIINIAIGACSATYGYVANFIRFLIVASIWLALANLFHLRTSGS